VKGDYVKGDSGSALVARYSDDEPWTIVGITSWSRGYV